MERSQDHHHSHLHPHQQQQKHYNMPMFSSDGSNTDSQQHQALFDYNSSNNSMSNSASISQGSNTTSSMHMSPSQSQQSHQNSQYAMDLIGNLMQMQSIELPPATASNSQSMNPSNSPATTAYSPQFILEQQIKLTQLQQLQQLQNQIFQQQMALISGQAGGLLSDPLPLDLNSDRSLSYHGLPTPGPSAELRPQSSPMEFVSPIVLNPMMDMPSSNISMTHSANSLSTQYQPPPRGSTSAPEAIAFRPSPSFQPPSPDDFDISPITSPWLGADHQQSYTHTPSSLSTASSNSATANAGSKRNASMSGDEGGSARKKQSPAIRPTNPMANSGTTKRTYKGSRSTNSTPLMRSTRSRKGSIAGEVVGDTPSPVDLSMPPPAPPNTAPAASSTSSMGSMPLASPNIDAQQPGQPVPATPASIMNLGRLGISSGLAPPAKQVPLQPAADGRVRTSAKAKDPAQTPAAGTKGGRKATGPLITPSPKAIRPVPSSGQPILPNSTLPSPLMAAAGAQGQPIQRKTSHKAAEQKRRDSLKTTFDDLRGLLPPIPLPTTDEKNGDDPSPAAAIPILPGALPPRGPPKAGGEGPNKGVSKLQLLICGNEYIRVLKRRSDRRDDEITLLRNEIIRLRGLVTELGGTWEVGEGGPVVDLARDLDDVERGSAGVWAFGRNEAGGSGVSGGAGSAGLGFVNEEDEDADAEL
ncbi:hypothetical protein BDN72DRAFT_889718 [Pluteus cervinus]|uniref:Uncharacterized protein n=1 Tax=Pluteus cervinus TaxID=181527 RepID=A0ACD3ADZ4_9AGAR|nr:hypothetical protein BDN72DRAFT_889718 [Pluteus cervinus]